MAKKLTNEEYQQKLKETNQVEIEREIKEGARGISGIGARGKSKIIH